MGYDLGETSLFFVMAVFAVLIFVVADSSIASSTRPNGIQLASRPRSLTSLRRWDAEPERPKLRILPQNGR